MSMDTLKVQIIKKAWADPAFKQSLLTDPKNAVKSAFGVDIPDDIEVTVVEEKPGSAVFVLPPSPEDVADAPSNVGSVWN